MSCINIQDQLSAYIDGELSSNELHHITEHIKQCDNCRMLYFELKSLVEEVNEIEQVALPSQFHQDLMLRINNETKPSKNFSFKYMNIAAIFVFVVVFSLIGVRQLSSLQKSYDTAEVAGFGDEMKMAESATLESETSFMVETTMEASDMTVAGAESIDESASMDTAPMATTRIEQPAENLATPLEDNTKPDEKIEPQQVLGDNKPKVEVPIAKMIAGLLGILFGIGILSYTLITILKVKK